MPATQLPSQVAWRSAVWFEKMRVAREDEMRSGGGAPEPSIQIPCQGLSAAAVNSIATDSLA